MRNETIKPWRFMDLWQGEHSPSFWDGIKHPEMESDCGTERESRKSRRDPNSYFWKKLVQQARQHTLFAAAVAWRREDGEHPFTSSPPRAEGAKTTNTCQPRIASARARDNVQGQVFLSPVLDLGRSRPLAEDCLRYFLGNTANLWVLRQCEGLYTQERSIKFEHQAKQNISEIDHAFAVNWPWCVLLSIAGRTGCWSYLELAASKKSLLKPLRSHFAPVQVPFAKWDKTTNKYEWIKAMTCKGAWPYGNRHWRCSSVFGIIPRGLFGMKRSVFMRLPSLLFCSWGCAKWHIAARVSLLACQEELSSLGVPKPDIRAVTQEISCARHVSEALRRRLCTVDFLYHARSSADVGLWVQHFMCAPFPLLAVTLCQINHLWLVHFQWALVFPLIDMRLLRGNWEVG